MVTQARVEIRCPRCKRYVGWRLAGQPAGGYCRDCKLSWDER